MCLLHVLDYYSKTCLQDSDPCQGASYCEVILHLHKLTILYIMFTGAQVLPVSPSPTSFGERRHYSAPPPQKCRRPRASGIFSKVNNTEMLETQSLQKIFKSEHYRAEQRRRRTMIFFSVLGVGLLHDTFSFIARYQ